jgi:D-aspartate ligase
VVVGARASGGAPGAVITGTNRIALAVARSLGRRGIRVLLVRTEDGDVTTLSRYVTSRTAWDGGAERRAGDLLAVVEREGFEGAVLVPTDDEQAALIARNHDALSQRLRVSVPHWETLRQAYDKREMHRLATSLGLDQPWTRMPENVDEVAELDCPYPVIIKPAIKSETNALTRAKAWRADDRAELLRRYSAACRLVDRRTIMIQELVQGDGRMQLSFGALCSRGEVVASLTARRRRQYPVDFGRNSTFVETVDELDIEEPARRLLAAMSWTGLIEVEFKRDPVSGRAQLLDANARGWTWVALGGRAGLDFPYLLWRQACGAEIAPAPAHPGVRWLRAGPDLLAAAGEMRRGRLSPVGYAMSLRRPMVFAVLARDDPIPALASPAVAAYRLAHRAVRRVAIPPRVSVATRATRPARRTG